LETFRLSLFDQIFSTKVKIFFQEFSDKCFPTKDF
jgi:hypothetical protein